MTETTGILLATPQHCAAAGVAQTAAYQRHKPLPPANLHAHTAQAVPHIDNSLALHAKHCQPDYGAVLHAQLCESAHCADSTVVSHMPRHRRAHLHQA